MRDDLKPNNVLIVDRGPTAQPQVKLADFGISLLLEAESSSTVAAVPPSPAVVSLGLLPLTDHGPGAMAPTLETSLPVEQSSRQPQAADEGTTQPSLLAKAQALTETGMIIGTPMYMASELARGSSYAQPAADVFSLGVLAFEMFTGQPPFVQPPILIRGLGGDLVVPPLLRSRQELDPALIALIERCIAAQPKRRPSAQELANALGDSAAT